MKLKKHLNFNYSNYKKSKCEIYYPKNKNDIIKIINYAIKNDKKILPIGSGLSWFDTIFNSENIILNLEKFKKKFAFDKKKGELIISSQFKIKEIIYQLNKFGWSLYSIPGGGDVSIGGCIGNDVHGKDSFKYGNFSQSIIELEIILPNKRIVKCSKKKNREIFKSVCGGLGLLGVITEIKIKLKPIAKLYSSINVPCNNYKELIKNLYEDINNFDYINGWVDIFAKNNKIGRSIIFKSKKIENKNLKSDNINTSKILNVVQKIFFGFCVKNNFTKYINFLIFSLFKFKRNNINSYKDISFPLSSYGVDIKEIIHPLSFFEIQIIIKKKKLPYDLKNFIIFCQKLKLSGFVIGIKMHKKNGNYLSFSDDGVSININQIFDSKKDYSHQLEKIKKLHDYVIKKNHKIYICKDILFNKKKNQIKLSSISKIFKY